MVAKISAGTSMSRLVNYNENKVKAGVAELLEAAGFRSERIGMSEKMSVFESLNRKNKTVKTNAVHISLNFDATDKIDDLLLRQISADYMQAIGFAGQPYLLYRHRDAGHEHVHIVTTTVQSDGKRIPLEFIGRDKSEPARKELEKLYGLVPAESKEKQVQQIKAADMNPAIYGKMETKRVISNIVREVVKRYNFTSLGELNAILQQFNIMADRGSKESRVYQRGGLNYSIIEADGNKVGVPIKASSIYGRPILSTLERKYAENKENRYGAGERLKRILDKILVQKGILTKQMLVDKLKEQQIEIVLRINEDGRLYGMTYVDLAGKIAFNGSTLGKQYSANAIAEKLAEARKTGLNPNPAAPTSVGNSIPETSNQNATAAGDNPAHEASINIDPNLNGLLDMLTAEAPYEEDIDFHFRKKRKKKR